MSEVLNPGKEELEARARSLLPAADQITVRECMTGRHPFKLVARVGTKSEFTFFTAPELALACKVVGTRLGIGAR